MKSASPYAAAVSGYVFLVAAAIGVSGVAAEPTYQLAVGTDRPDALHEVGQTANFSITVTCGDEPVSTGTISYVVDDFITEHAPESGFPSGELELDGRERAVAVTLDRPGFLRCLVSYQTPEDKTLRAIAAVGFSPRQLKPSLSVPHDFDSFWAAQREQLAQVPWEPELNPIDQSNSAIQCFDVQVPCLGGAPVSGYLALPVDAEPRSLPAVLWVHGAGVRSSSLSNAVKGAQSHMLSMDINAHGIPNGKPGAFYQGLAAGRLKGYRQEGRQSRDTVYFRGMFLRLVRAIDFLTSREQWDGKVVAVIGHSQGGGQALVAGGIDDRVTMIAAGVPAICDHSGRAAGRINGWPKLVPTDEDGKPDPAILEASRYVDAVNFASRFRGDAILSVGFIDAVCPPSSVYAAYNSLTGSKRMINEPLMGHAAPPHIYAEFFEEIQQHVQRKQAKR